MQRMGVDPDSLFVSVPRVGWMLHPEATVTRPLKKAAGTVKLKRAVRRKSKDDVEAWMLLAMGHVIRQHPSDALTAIAKAVKLAPDDARIPALRALVSWQQKRPDRAIPFAEEAIAKGYELYELRMGLAQHARKETADFEKAKEHLRIAITLFPQDPSHR